MSLDDDQVDAGIADLNSKLAGIRDKALNIGLNQAQVDAAIADIQAKLEALRGQALGGVGINQGELDAQIAAIQAKLTALGAEHVDINIGASGAPETTAELGGVAAVMKAIEVNSGPLAAAIAGLTAAEKDTGDESETVASRLGDLGGQARQAYGWMGMLTKEVTLFGGALGDTHMVGQIPLWHILLDAVLETTIGLTEATIALGVFAAAAAPAAEDIYDHIKSTDDVVKALGVDIPPVTGHFHDLTEAMAPQVVELYGGALNLMGKSGSALEDVVSRLVTGFDDWMAKLDEFSAKQSHTDGIVQAGADVLQQMSVILDDLGVAFENLVKADPGTVHFLLDVAQGAAKLIEVFTEIPTPILQATLAVHSFMLWGGLLGTAMSKLLVPLRALSVGLGGVAKDATAVGQLGEEAGGLDRLKAVLSDIGTGFSTFGTNIKTATGDAEGFSKISAAAGTAVGGLGSKLAALATSPWTWVVTAAAALGYLGYEFSRTTSAAKTFLATWDSQIANDTPSQALIATGIEIGQIYQTQIPDAFKAASDGMRPFYTAYHQMMGDLTSSPLSNSWFKNLGNAIADAGKAAVDYFPDLIVGQQAQNSVDTYTRAIANLTGQQDNLFREVGNLMKVQTDYTDQTGRAASGIHAVGGSFTTTTTSAYSYAEALALMGLAGVKATDSFATMEQKVDNLITGYQDMSVQGGILANAVDAVTFASEQSSSQISAVTQGFTTFISTVTGGESAFVTFAQGMSTLGTDVAAAGAKMDGLNANSLTLRAGFTQQITQASAVQNSLMTLASAAGLGSKGTADLTQAGKDMVAQLLPMAQGSADATAQLYALAQTAGYRGPDAFQSLVGWVGKTGNAEQNLQEITSKLTVAAGDLTTDMENLAQAVGTTLNTAMSEAIFQASGGQKAFDAFATAALNAHGNLGKMHDSALQLAEELLTTIGNTSQAHQEFDTFAIQLGLTKTQADKLWASVVRLAQAEDGIPKNVSSTITITEDLIGATGAGAASGSGSRVHSASGGQVRGGSGRPRADDIPAMLSDKEWVIQTPAVEKYGSQFFENVNAMRYADGGQALAGARRSSGGSGLEAPGAPVINNNSFNYYGTQYPTPEQQQAMVMNLTSAVGLAG